MRVRSLLSCCAVAVALAGSALSSDLSSMGGPATPSPTPASTPAPEPAAAGIVTSVNLSSIKAVFAAANVSVEQKAYSDGTSYLSAMIRGNATYVGVGDCQGDPNTGNCSTVNLASGTSVNPAPESMILAFNNTYRLSRVIAASETDRHVTLIMNYAVSGGVGPDFVKSQFTFFANDTATFIDLLQKASAAKGSPAPSSGFLKEPSKSSLFEKSLSSPLGSLAPAPVSH